MEKSDQLIDQIRRHSQLKSLRDLASAIRSGLYIAGLLSSSGVLIHDYTIGKVTNDLIALETEYSARLSSQQEGQSLVVLDLSTADIIAGLVTFDPTSAFTILDSQNIDSITDASARQYRISLTQAFGDFTYCVLTASDAEVIQFTKTEDGLALVFDREITDILTVIFYKEILTTA